ncbi:uncharacterized protein TNCV_2154061 [Trichonephila clavipes]|nr:uncharacterized protein TNCV_2154061 [Trichonephila clavipes]
MKCDTFNVLDGELGSDTDLRKLLTDPQLLASPQAWDLQKREHREFNRDWTESFAFICNSDCLPTCLICHEKLAHNKKSNVVRHLTAKHIQLASKYPTGEERKKAVQRASKTKTAFKFHVKNAHDRFKSKALWRGKITELKSKLEDVELQKCMYVTQQRLTASKEIP